MIIQLPADVEHSLLEKVDSGLFPSLDAAMTRAAYLLLEQIEQAATAKPKQKAKQAKKAKPVQQRLTEEEFDQHLLALGLLSQIPDTDVDFDDPDDEPIEIRGEPLSKTVIRDRR